MFFRFIWSHAEVFSKKNAATFSSEKVLHISFFRFCLCWNITKTPEICIEIAWKTFRRFLGQFRAFSLTNCIRLSTEVHWNNDFFHCLGVWRFKSTRSIDILTKMNKNFENWKLFDFCLLTCQFETFFKLKNSIYLFTRSIFPSWTFQHSNPRIPRKHCIKTLKSEESYGFFVVFGVNLRSFPSSKQQLSLPKSLFDNNFLTIESFH